MNSEIPVIILAGGLGTRLSEETDKKPKPMVNIGVHPIIWHIMKIYSSQGFKKFLIATGYKHEVLDSWIAENDSQDSWGFECEVTSYFTGLETQTGGRLRRIMEAHPASTYMVTYGDGLANVNLQSLLDFHISHQKTATVTSVRPPARFGYIESENGQVTHFGEKNQANTGWINGGFFILENNVQDFLGSDEMPFEMTPMNKLVSHQQLMTFQHQGFWQPMDTLREKQMLTNLASEEHPPWTIYS